MSVRFWRSAGHFAASYKHCLCISREICNVPSLTDGLIRVYTIIIVYTCDHCVIAFQEWPEHSSIRN